jgi:hypothetical protein
MSFHEKRANHRLLTYWQGLCGDRPYPAEKDIDLEAISDIADHIFLLHTNVSNARSGFRYGAMGASLIRAYGDNFSGQDVYDALLCTRRDTIVEDVVRVLATQAPVTQEAVFINSQQVQIKYRRILCPLGSSDGGSSDGASSDMQRIDYIIGAMRWKAE